MRPSETLVVAKNENDLRKKLQGASNAGDFRQFIVKERGFGFLGGRLDVLAEFNDGSQLIVDSIGKQQGELDLLTDHSARAAFLITYRYSAENKPIATLRAYFIEPTFERRQYDLICSWSASGSAGTGKPPSALADVMKFSNLTFAKEVRELSFDVTTLCANFKTSAGVVWIDPSETHWAYAQTRTATLVAKLSDKAHLEWVNRAPEIAAWRKSLLAEEECVAEAKSEPNRKEGEIFPCFIYRNAPGGSRSSSLNLYRFQREKLVKFDSTACENLYWTKDPSRLAVFSTCFHNLGTDEAPRVRLGLSIHLSDGLERYIPLEGNCKSLHGYGMRFIAERAVRLTLHTNCSEVWSNGQKFPTGFVSAEEKSELNQPFILSITEDEIVSDFFRARS